MIIKFHCNILYSEFENLTENFEPFLVDPIILENEGSPNINTEEIEQGINTMS